MGNALKSWFMVLLCLVIAAPAPAAQKSSKKRDLRFRVVGYLPDYRIEQVDPAVARQLTDVILFSVTPEASGKFSSKILESPKSLAWFRQLRDDQRVNVMVCVGGWERSKGFAEIAAAPALRRKFAKGLADYCKDKGFAGADIDWEHPKDALEAKNYGLLLADISKAFKPSHLQLTAAMASWQTLTNEAIEAVDAIHLMSYDAKGKHSTLETAQTDVRKLLVAGVPSKKIRLGIPLYGRGIADRDQVKTYAEILAKDPNAAESDESNGLYYNGPATIQAKIEFAREQKLGGVMIWEIGQDAPADASLLKVIDEAVTTE